MNEETRLPNRQTLYDLAPLPCEMLRPIARHRLLATRSRGSRPTAGPGSGCRFGRDRRALLCLALEPAGAFLVLPVWPSSRAWRLAMQSTACWRASSARRAAPAAISLSCATSPPMRAPCLPLRLRRAVQLSGCNRDRDLLRGTSEYAGVMGPLVGASRRYDGPFRQERPRARVRRAGAPVRPRVDPRPVGPPLFPVHGPALADMPACAGASRSYDRQPISRATAEGHRGGPRAN